MALTSVKTVLTGDRRQKATDIRLLRAVIAPDRVMRFADFALGVC